MSNWKTWLIQGAWFTATLGVGGLSFPLLFFSIFNPAVLALFAIMALGYGASLWSCEAARHRRMALPRDRFLHEMFIHGLVLIGGFVATAILAGPGLFSGVSM